MGRLSLAIASASKPARGPISVCVVLVQVQKAIEDIYAPFQGLSPNVGKAFAFPLLVTRFISSTITSH